MAMVMLMDMATEMETKARRIIIVAGVTLLGMATPVFGQGMGLSTPSISGGQNVPGGTSLAPAGGIPGEADPGSTVGRSWNIVPRISLTETLTNNVNLSSTNKQNDLISQVAPGVRIDGQTARMNMYLDYALIGSFYASESQKSFSQNRLNMFGTLEAVDNWMFIDFGANISQQLINPFGQQTPSNAFNNNVADTGTYRISPYIRGELGGLVDYSLRYNRSFTNSGASGYSNVDLAQWLGQLRGNTRFQNLSWVIDGSQQNTDYSNGRDYNDQRLRAMLVYRLFPQLNVMASVGTESNNYQSLNDERQETYGYGLDWRPTERSQVYGFMEERFFGKGHNVVISHRFPLSSIRYIDTRDVSFIPNQSATYGIGSLYDIYYEQFATLIPDPGARAAYVSNLLTQAGLAPNAQVTSDYLANRPRIQRRQQLTMTLYGSRNSLTFLAGRNNNEALSVVPGAGGQAISNLSRVEQQGYSLSFAHRLTPLTALNLVGSRQRTESGEFAVVTTTMTTYRAGITTRFGSKTVGSLYARYSQFDSPTNPYDESAIVGSISFLF